MNVIQYFQAPIDTKAIEKKADGSLRIKGYASTKDLDRYSDVVEPKAFENTLETFMKNPIMLLQHEATKPIGKFDTANIDAKGLEVAGDVLYDVDNCKKQVEDGVLTTFSIGYIPKKYEIVNAEGELVATEAGYEPGYGWEDVWFGVTTRTIKELDLIEISIVSTPANPHAVFSLEKSIKNFFESEKERMLELKKLGEKKEAEGVDTPSEEKEDLSSVEEEALKNSETAGESPAPSEDVPEAVVAENAPASSETPAPEDSEEKSVKERKDLDFMTKKIEGLEAQIKTFSDVSVKLVELVEAQNEEIKTLRDAIGNIQLKKGLASLG